MLTYQILYLVPKNPQTLGQKKKIQKSKKQISETHQKTSEKNKLHSETDITKPINQPSLKQFQSLTAIFPSESESLQAIEIKSLTKIQKEFEELKESIKEMKNELIDSKESMKKLIASTIEEVFEKKFSDLREKDQFVLKNSLKTIIDERIKECTSDPIIKKSEISFFVKEITELMQNEWKKKSELEQHKTGSDIQPEEVEVVLTENKSDPEVKTKNFKYIFLIIFVPKDLPIQKKKIQESTDCRYNESLIETLESKYKMQLTMISNIWENYEDDSQQFCPGVKHEDIRKLAPQKWLNDNVLLLAKFFFNFIDY